MFGIAQVSSRLPGISRVLQGCGWVHTAQRVGSDVILGPGDLVLISEETHIMSDLVTSQFGVCPEERAAGP